MRWWVADLFHNNPTMLFAWAFWVIFSITLHELGHGWAAIRRGDRTPIELGRMTWNPLVHMGGFSLLVFALVGIAWGVMPVNPSRLRGRRAEAYVAAAGPFMNLILAAACIVLAALWSAYAGDGDASEVIMTFLFTGAMLNVVLMLFNLLPVPPLDGARILADFVPAYGRLFNAQNGQMIALALFVLIFLTAWRFIFPFASAVVNGAIDVLLVILPGAA
ncbi:MAG: site-2 protease family protein [Phycisphaerales bacterium]|nr:MAG: site-2 protease family protein [Phycisphaerales bacterium]